MTLRGYGFVVNATSLGMSASDPLPFDPAHLDGGVFVGDAVPTADLSPLLKAVVRRGCRYQVGTDMLFEQISRILRLWRRNPQGAACTLPDLIMRACSKMGLLQMAQLLWADVEIWSLSSKEG